MSALIAQLRYRAKAVVVAVTAILSAAAVAALEDPSIQTTVAHLVPVAYQPYAVLLIGAIVTGIVHQIPRGEKPATRTDEAPVTELPDSFPTTRIQIVSTDGGH